MKFYANPYNPDANGFYFETFEEFENQAENLIDSFGAPVEEFHLEFIDGEKYESELFEKAKINTANLEQFIEFMESVHPNEAAILSYLLSDLNMKFEEETIDMIDEVNLYEGTLLDAASEMFDELYLHDVPEGLRNYIDYDSFANDEKCEGNMVEFTFAGKTYTVTNASEL